jgi:hypothetical protein
MTKYSFPGQLQILVSKAESGSPADIDFIISSLTPQASPAVTRYVDFALGLLTFPAGVECTRHFLFNDTKIQRNYASLYFNPTGEQSDVE